MGVWIGAGGVVVLGLIAAGVLAVRKQAPEPQPGSVSATASAAPAPEVGPASPTVLAPASAAVAPPPAPSAAMPAPSAAIKLDVTTEPPGATVTKDGFQVCDQTPCQVMAGLNETLELEAAKGAMRAKARVLAQRDQRVTMKLVAPGRPKPRLCEVEVDGLKILRPCQ